MTTREFAPGNFRFVPAVFQYSGGVAALPGFEIRRVMFRKPIPLAEGFRAAEAAIRAAGRPLTAFCACELRSPAPFSESGFKTFNESYVSVLTRWGLSDGTSNPVARSNVCPQIDPPSEVSMYAFCYTVSAEHASPTFVVAGSGEAPEGHANYRDHIVRRGDTSVDGLREKARFVLAEMERRMAALGHSWKDTTAVQVYTVHNIVPFLPEEIVRRGAANHGLAWHYHRPPVVDLDYEMDCRGILQEIAC
ncbi:MAG TPA: hypothetical protein VGD13_16445 [Xanthobacteraceae bacterium]|jgi:hypothetical protein